MPAEDHRARLEEMAEAMRQSSRKRPSIVGVLKSYIRREKLDADVVLFPNGEVRVIWQRDR